MAQSEFFGFVEVDLDLGAASVGLDSLNDAEFKVRGHQIPGLELFQPRHDHDDEACLAGAPTVDAAQEDFSIVDFNRSLFALDTQFAALLAQAIRESPDQLVNATFLPIGLLPPLPRLAARGEVDHLIGPHASERELTEGGERTQEWARKDPAINDPDVADACGQPELRRESADQRRDAPAFDIEQRTAGARLPSVFVPAHRTADRGAPRRHNSGL